MEFETLWISHRTDLNYTSRISNKETHQINKTVFRELGNMTGDKVTHGKIRFRDTARTLLAWYQLGEVLRIDKSVIGSVYWWYCGLWRDNFYIKTLGWTIHVYKIKTHSPYKLKLISHVYITCSESNNNNNNK